MACKILVIATRQEKAAAERRLAAQLIHGVTAEWEIAIMHLLILTRNAAAVRFASIWMVSAALAAAHFIGARGFGQDTEIDAVRNRLHAFRDEYGKTPTLADFWTLACDDNGKVRVTKSNFLPIWEAFSEIQQASISKRDLLELHQGTRDAIFDLQFKCDLEQRLYEGGTVSTVGRFTSKFAVTETKILLWTDRDRDGTAVEYVRTYDGERVRSVLTHPGAANAQVLPFNSWSTYYVSDSNPLFGAMLLDSPRVMGLELPLHDLRLFLEMTGATVLEERRNVGGHDCLVVGNADCQVCVAPALNFTVVQLLQSNASGDTAPALAFRCDLSDFVDLGNGVWLPRKMQRRFFADGSNAPALVREEIAVFDDMRINQEIPDAMFTDCIPKGTVVWDTLRNITYIEGDKSSIQSLVDGAMPPRGTQGLARTWLVWSNVLVFVVIMLVLMWHRRRANSRQGAD